MSRGIYETILLNAASILNAVGTFLTNLRTDHYVFYVEWGAATSAGTVVIEEADNKEYAGTWKTVGTCAWVAASQVDAVHLYGAYGALRARISVAVVGGTVTVRMKSLAT